MRSLEGECLIREFFEHSSPLPTTQLEESQRIVQILLVREETLDVRIFIGIKQRRILFNHDPLHPIDADRVTIDEMDCHLLDRPGSGSNPRGQLPRTEPGHSLPKLLRTGNVNVNELAIHFKFSFYFESTSNRDNDGVILAFHGKEGACRHAI